MVWKTPAVKAAFVVDQREVRVSKMCGIAGRVGAHFGSRDTLKRITDSQIHRHPDDDFAMAFNCEIYNFSDLRVELLIRG